MALHTLSPSPQLWPLGGAVSSWGAGCCHRWPSAVLNQPRLPDGSGQTRRRRHHLANRRRKEPPFLKRLQWGPGIPPVCLEFLGKEVGLLGHQAHQREAPWRQATGSGSYAAHQRPAPEPRRPAGHRKTLEASLSRDVALTGPVSLFLLDSNP